MKLVINDCYGGFNLSPKALLWLYEKGMKSLAMPVEEYFGPYKDDDGSMSMQQSLKEWREYQNKERNSYDCLFVSTFTPDEKMVLGNEREIARHDPLLIECVETLGEEANGACSDLKIIEIPDGVDYVIEEYDGSEWVSEKHRTWS